MRTCWDLRAEKTAQEIWETRNVRMWERVETDKVNIEKNVAIYVHKLGHCRKCLFAKLYVSNFRNREDLLILVRMHEYENSQHRKEKLSFYRVFHTKLSNRFFVRICPDFRRIVRFFVAKSCQPTIDPVTILVFPTEVFDHWILLIFLQSTMQQNVRLNNSSTRRI